MRLADISLFQGDCLLKVALILNYQNLVEWKFLIMGDSEQVFLYFLE